MGKANFWQARSNRSCDAQLIVSQVLYIVRAKRSHSQAKGGHTIQRSLSIQV